MSEHTWVLENLSGYLVGGLEASERRRVEKHLAGCDSCRNSFDEAEAVDRRMQTLFADARPRPGLEDRVISALRQSDEPLMLRLPPWMRLAAGAAAVLVLGVVGAVAGNVMEHGWGGLGFRSDREAHAPVAHGGEVRSKSADGYVRYGVEAASDYRQAEPAVKGEFDEAQQAPAESTAFRRVGGAGGPNQADAHFDQLRKEALGDYDATKARLYAESIGARRSAPVEAPDSNVLYLEETKNADRLRRDEESERLNARSRGEGREGQGWFAGGPGAAPGNRPNSENERVARIAPTTPPRQAAPGPVAPGASVAGKDAYYSRTAPGLDNAVADGSKKLSETFYNYDLVAPTPPAEPSGRRPTEPGTGKVARPVFEPAKSFRPGELAQAGADPRGEAGKVPEKKDSAPADPKSDPSRQSDGKPEAQPMGGSPAPAAAPRRLIIRSGEMEFEIDSFDSTVQQVVKIAGEEGGFIATVNSDKLPNGKVRGTVVVRVPPERLDVLILKLRALGELKSQRLGSQDITKMYTDLESRLRAARTMEERLIQIIKTGKGEIKDLLAAEKELGVWRTRIEEITGEMNYYNNLVSLATLTVTLWEKDIRSAAVAVETERIQLGLETEDVESTYKKALEAIAAAKGRVTRSELKKHEAEQFSGLIICETSADAAGPLLDRLKQLGRAARLDVNRSQTAEGGRGLPDLKVRRVESIFTVSLYNLANVAPRETVHASLAAADAEEVYKKILARVEKAGGRVVTSQINRQRADQISGTINFEVPAAVAEAVELDLRGLGEVIRINRTENPDTANVTRSKRGFAVSIVSLGTAAARETAVIQLAAADVAIAYRTLHEQAGKLALRILNARLDESDRSNVHGTLDIEVRRGKDEDAINNAIAAAGLVFTRTVHRRAESDNVVEGKLQITLSLIDSARIPPRETHSVQAVVRDVSAAYRAMSDAIAKAGGRVLNSQLNEADRSNVTALLDFEVRREHEAEINTAILGTGEIYTRHVQRNPEARGTLDTKVRIQLSLLDLARIPARESTMLQIAAKDPGAAYNALRETVARNGGRVINARLEEADPRNVVGTLEFEIARKDSGAVAAALAAAGETSNRNVQRAPENSGAVDSKLHFNVTLTGLTRVPPRDTLDIALEVPDVGAVAQSIIGWINEKNGRTLISGFDTDRPGVHSADLAFDVPLREAPALFTRIRGAGKVLRQKTYGNVRAPEGDNAVARIIVKISNPTAIVAEDSGLWPSVRKGLSQSLAAIFYSIQVVVMGLVFVGPWAIILWYVWRLMKRSRGRTPTAPTPAGSGGGTPGAAA